MKADLQKMKAEQLRLAKRVETEDRLSKTDTIAGCDQAFFGDKIISAIVVCDYRGMDVIEKEYTVMRETFPYIPGFLSYREGPAIIKAYKKLRNKPDVLLFDGNGILHKLRIGIASHIGVLLNKPATIGVAKNLLCGRVKNKKIYVNNEIRGFVLKTKAKCRPVYVSPGHRIGLESSIRIVKACLKGHKLPEPLRLAHLYANEVKMKRLKFIPLKRNLLRNLYI